MLATFHVGWATDLKTVSDEIIAKRAQRTGDGTRAMKTKSDENNNETEEEHSHSDIWGWDDKEMTEENRKCVKILYKFYD